MKRPLKVAIIEARPHDAETFLQIASSVELSPALWVGDMDHEIGFVRTCYSSPKSRDKFIVEFRDNIVSLENVLVAEIGSQIVGFLMAYTKDEWLSMDYGKMMLKNVKWFNGTRSIQNIMRTEQWTMVRDICISRNRVRQGIGRQLLQVLITRLRQQKIGDCFAYVTTFPIRNEVSLMFFRKKGFADVGEICEHHISSYMGPTNFIERLLHLRFLRSF